MSEHIASFEIFRGRFAEKNVSWLETIEGQASAHRRMHEIAAQKPGPYFVFSTWNHAVIATVDTTPQYRKNAGAA